MILVDVGCSLTDVNSGDGEHSLKLKHVDETLVLSLQWLYMLMVFRNLYDIRVCNNVVNKETLISK